MGQGVYIPPAGVLSHRADHWHRPSFLPLFTNDLEGAFSEVRIQQPAQPRSPMPSGSLYLLGCLSHRAGAPHKEKADALRPMLG
jgi:hypothetical protein